MKHFLKKILSIENHINDNAYLVKVIKFLGLTFKIPVYKKLKPLNNFFVKLPPVYLSIVAISKNEAPYIKEWIEYHKLVGVERFYFYRLRISVFDSSKTKYVNNNSDEDKKA